MTIKDIKQQYSTTGSGSRGWGVFVSLVIMCNKTRCRIISGLFFSAFTKIPIHLFEMIKDSVKELQGEGQSLQYSFTHEIKNINKTCGWGQQKDFFDFRLKDISISPKISSYQVLELWTGCANLWCFLSLFHKITDIHLVPQYYFLNNLRNY